VAEHHKVPTGALPAPLSAHLHQLAHQAPGPVPGHTVVVGGMPGWQIALIAAGAGVLAAALAVLLDRGPGRPAAPDRPQRATPRTANRVPGSASPSGASGPPAAGACKSYAATRPSPP